MSSALTHDRAVEQRAIALAPALDPVEDLGPTSFDASSSTGEAGYAIIRRQLGIVHVLADSVRQSDDPEDVHDARVAIRRMRTAMRIFSDALPARTRKMRDEWKWLGSVLGDVRDLDVHLRQLATWTAQAAGDEAELGALKMVASMLEERRFVARSALLKALDSRRARRMHDALAAMLTIGPGRHAAARPPVVLAAPELVVQRYRKVRSLGDHVGEDAAPHALHTLRIRLKRLRYTVEFFEPLYGKPSRAFVRRVVALQDVLGEHQDATAAVRMLHDIATDGRVLEPDLVFAMGRIAERFAARTSAARHDLPDAYEALKGRRWRRLRSSMGAESAPAREAAPAIRPQKSSSTQTEPVEPPPNVVAEEPLPVELPAAIVEEPPF